MFPKGSVVGCYLISIDLSLLRSDSKCYVSTISLTPNGASTNYVLDFILHDLARVAHSGIIAIDCEVERCVVHIDVAGFVGDYPAQFTVIDCM